MWANTATLDNSLLYEYGKYSCICIMKSGYLLLSDETKIEQLWESHD